jgi:hypothetical protein
MFQVMFTSNQSVGKWSVISDAILQDPPPKHLSTDDVGHIANHPPVGPFDTATVVTQTRNRETFRRHCVCFFRFGRLFLPVPMYVAEVRDVYKLRPGGVAQ